MWFNISKLHIPPITWGSRKSLLSFSGQMFYLTEPVWSLHLSGTSSCRISVRAWIFKSGQLLANKWMVWKWTGFQHKGFTVLWHKTVHPWQESVSGPGYSAGWPRTYTLPSDNRGDCERGQKTEVGVGVGLKGTETYYTIHLWDSRRATWNYILFLVDYDNYKTKKAGLTPFRFF